MNEKGPTMSRRRHLPLRPPLGLRHERGCHLTPSRFALIGMVAAALFLGGFSAEGFLLGRDLRSEEQQQQQRGGVVASRSSLPRRSGAAGRGGIVGAGAAAEASAAATAATNHHKNPLHLPLLHHNHHPTHYGTHQIGSHTLQTTLAGRIWPVLRKTLEALHPTKLKTAAHSVLEVANWQGVVFLLAVAYGTVPLTRMVWERSEVGRHLKSSGSQEGGDDEAEDGDDYDVDAAVSSSFPSWSDLKRRHAAEVASGLARVALTVYGVDVACVALTSLGFAFPSRWQIPTVFSKVAYAGWGLRTFLRFKTAALCRIFKVSPEAIQSGRLDLLNRTLTAVSVGLVSLLLLDWLSIRMGVALKGLLTLGSVGTLAFSLASKDLVSQFISGVFLSASSKVYKGDDVLFGDGTRGTIVKLGFVDTVLRSGDNYLTSVPNSKLANQKVSNLSRVRISQVAQTLRFHYEDADEIPALLETIKKEIREACPRLIADGSRPFRVFWTGFKEDHLEVMVDAHFQIPPIGDAYWINRQQVLMAINRAVKHHNLEFAKLYKVEPGMQQPAWRVVDPTTRSKTTTTTTPSSANASQSGDSDRVTPAFSDAAGSTPEEKIGA